MVIRSTHAKGMRGAVVLHAEHRIELHYEVPMIMYGSAIIICLEEQTS